MAAHSSALFYSLLSVPVQSQNKMQPNVFLPLVNVKIYLCTATMVVYSNKRLN